MVGKIRRRARYNAHTVGKEGKNDRHQYNFDSNFIAFLGASQVFHLSEVDKIEPDLSGRIKTLAFTISKKGHGLAEALWRWRSRVCSLPQKS
ncbi:hypothetical protein RB195_009951 [Necator americanus]|uniref:Uncharacterized protein n=1 Tax=Necator americanus TaxID=51031 RepID=A0ABR1CVN3_NECAM